MHDNLKLYKPSQSNELEIEETHSPTLLSLWNWWEELHPKVYPLKAWVGPSKRRRRRRISGDFMSLIGSKESVDAGLKQLKIVSRGEDGGWEWVPVSGGHRESACSIFIQFGSEGVLGVRKPLLKNETLFQSRTILRHTTQPSSIQDPLLFDSYLAPGICPSSFYDWSLIRIFEWIS